MLDFIFTPIFPNGKKPHGIVELSDLPNITCLGSDETGAYIRSPSFYLVLSLNFSLPRSSPKGTWKEFLLFSICIYFGNPTF